jgi:ribose transport system substrate-binding protein
MRHINIILSILCSFICNVSFAQDSKSLVIAFAQDTMKNDFRVAQVFEVRDEVAKYPYLSFAYSDAQGQTSLLIHQINKFIEQKVGVLIIGTNDEQAVVPVISQARKAGIHVIILDRGIKGTDYSTFINSDNVQIGHIGAQFLANKLKGKGLVLLFEGLQSADVTHLRSRGFMEEMANHPNIKVIKRTGNYLRKDALAEMDKLLKEGIKVDGIFAESDSMLSGARFAMKSNKVDPNTIISVGCDFTSEAREAIRNGSQTGSVLFPLGGKQAVESSRNLLAGKSVLKHIIIPTKLVTNSNVEQTLPIF